MNCGMIATGNHIYFDSLRDAPPRRSGSDFYSVNNDANRHVSSSNDTAQSNRCVGGVMTPPYIGVYVYAVKQQFISLLRLCVGFDILFPERS